ncbi:hypothetical protein R83H12_02072 [Fibrobacteria bacterium R8-3-H12]
MFRLKLLLLLLASLAYADFGEVWIKKYAFAAGVDIAASKGDLDGISTIKNSPVEETVILPKVPFFFVYAFDARALANAHSIALNFGLGFPDYKHLEQSGEATYLRYGIEYQYHFLWPEPFRIGAGLGFAFSSMMFPHTSLTGNGGHAVLSAQYYFTENFALESAIRCRFLYLNRVATDSKNDVSRLSEAVWQGVGEFGLRGMLVF